MMAGFKYVICVSILLLAGSAASAQVDRKEVRSGNRQFSKGNWQRSEIDYRKALVKDTASFAASYNLAGALYRQDNFEEAGKSLEKLKEVAPENEYAADYYYNLGNIAVKKKDWAGAVDAYKQSLLRSPEDMDAKENYAYAKLMLQKDGGGGGGCGKSCSGSCSSGCSGSCEDSCSGNCDGCTGGCWTTSCTAM